jgi:site-specific DNA-methyltransferase (adenine-specific)
MDSIVHHADCMEIMAQYPDKHFDLAVVDPPYGLGEKLTQGGTWASKYTKQDSIWDVAPNESYFNELFRVSENQIIWGGNYFGLTANRCFLIWDKVAHMDTLSDCEYAWTSFDKNAKIFKQARNTSQKRIHPTQKPIKLYDWIYKNYLTDGGKVIDTHLGSGSNRIAADKAGNINFVGCELDRDYFDAQEKRWSNYKAQLTIQF